MKDNWGQNAAFKAVQLGNMVVLKAMLVKFPDLGDKAHPFLQQDKETNNLLIHAVFKGHTNTAVWLMGTCPSLCGMKDNWGQNAAFKAVQLGNMVVLKNIAKVAPASLQQTDLYGFGLLSYAKRIYQGNKQNSIVEWLETRQNSGQNFVFKPSVTQQVINITHHYHHYYPAGCQSTVPLPNPMPKTQNKQAENHPPVNKKAVSPQSEKQATGDVVNKKVKIEVSIYIDDEE